MQKNYSLLLIVWLLSTIALFAQDGTLDPNFTPAGTAYVRAVKRLSNGKVLISHSSGISGGLKMFNDNGTDFPFTFQQAPQQTEFSNNWVQQILEQPDGKIILVNAASSPKIFRYNPDGSKDSLFQANVGTGANITIRKGLLDSDGKIVLIGQFTSFNNVPKGGIVRLNSDGTIDDTFLATGQSFTPDFKDIVKCSTGGYFIGGSINNFNGSSYDVKTVKILSDGTRDTSWHCEMNGNFTRILQIADGKLIGANGTEIQRLKLDGTEDTILAGIGAGSSSAAINAMHLQADGKIIVVGSVTMHVKHGSGNPQTVHDIYRMLPSGDLDTTFNVGTGPSQNIWSSELTNTGAVLVGGAFWMFNGQTRDYVARLINSGLPPNVNPPAAILALPSSEQVNVYPNPTKDLIYLSGDADFDRAEIYNSMGQQMRSFVGNGLHQIDLAEFQNGFYLVKLIKNGAMIKMERVVKI